MRRWNAWISIAILALLVVHCIIGGLRMTGVMSGGETLMSAISHTMLVLIAFHIAFGVKLTIDTVRANRKTKVAYPKENRNFWTRRLSGAAIFVLVLFHLFIFMWTGTGVFSATTFTGAQLVASILLVAAIVIHVATNIKPLLISFGTGVPRIAVGSLLFILAIIALLCAVAFIIYYLRGVVL